MKILGIDYGTKKVGLALSDEGGRIAFPLSVIPNDKTLLQKISDICKKEEVGAIVIGESLDYKGEPNPIMKKINVFHGQLEEKTGKPVFLSPEFLSSKQARNILDSGEKNDASAAAIILQTYLDKQIKPSSNQEAIF